MLDICIAALEEPPGDSRSSGMRVLHLKTWFAISVMLCLLASARGFGAPVSTTEALVVAVRDGAEGAMIEIAPGTYELAKSFRFEDNIIECKDQERPLFRNNESGGSVVVNNRLTGISDTASYENRSTKATPRA